MISNVRSFAHLWAVPLAFLAVCAYLSLKGLDNAVFWDDEAETAIIARNFLRFGQLTGWDGRNLFAYRNGSVLDDHLRSINPPLNFWVCAASFKLLGQTTWAGRFPFVLTGLLALFVFWLAVREDFGEDRWTAFYMLASFGLSVNFLLNIRQCRYNALAILFSLLTYYAYRRLLAARPFRFAVLLAASAFLLFLSHYLIGAAFLLALGVVFLLFDRSRLDRKAWGGLFLAAGLFGCAVVFYVVRNRIWDRPPMPFSEPFPLRQARLVWWNLRDLNLAAFLPWPIAAGAAWTIAARWRREPMAAPMARWGCLGLASVVFVALMSPQPTRRAEIADLRYILASLPFLAGLTGASLRLVHRASRWAGLGLLAVVIGANALTLGPPPCRFRWLLPAYIGEIHRDYPTAYEAVWDYLVKNAQPEDLVFTAPTEAAYPLMFYVGDRVRFGCALDQGTRLPRPVVDSLDAPLWFNRHFPQWIVSFAMREETADMAAYFSRPHAEEGRTIQFRYPLMDTLNVCSIPANRPELPWHSFGPVTEFDRETNAIYVFARTGDILKAMEPSKAGNGTAILPPSH